MLNSTDFRPLLGSCPIAPLPNNCLQSAKVFYVPNTLYSSSIRIVLLELQSCIYEYCYISVSLCQKVSEKI